MCTDDFGCSPDDCEPGLTPCGRNERDCGDGEAACNLPATPPSNPVGVCSTCGVNCVLDCVDGFCDEQEVTQFQCNQLAQQLGSDQGCTVTGEDDSCTCPGIPEDLCDGEVCYTVPGDGGSFFGTCE